MPHVRQVAPSGGEQNTARKSFSGLLVGGPYDFIVGLGVGNGSGLVNRVTEHTAQANTAHKPNVHDISVAKTSRAEIDSDLRGIDKTPSTSLVRQKAHHQVLQQPAGVLQLDVGAARGVGRLLQENGVASDFGDVDGDAEALAGEYGVHDRNVLMCEVTADGEYEDAREQGGRGRGGELGRGRWVVSGAGAGGQGG